VADLSRNDSGTATAELAVALPAVVLSFAAVIAVGQAVVAQVSCIDAARAGARAAARGDTNARVVALARDAAGSPSGGGAAQVTVKRGSSVQVEVTRRVRLVLPHGPRVAVVARASSEAEGWGGAQASDDGGSATVLLLAGVLVAFVLAVACAGLGSALAARHRAESAADLSALAAASAPAASACPVAARMASAQGARLATCQADDGNVRVSVAVTPAGPAGRLGLARAVARAGPAPLDRATAVLGDSGQGSR
jgi:secretion/DNA translocation related TadE-like protein